MNQLNALVFLTETFIFSYEHITEAFLAYCWSSNSKSTFGQEFLSTEFSKDLGVFSEGTSVLVSLTHFRQKFFFSLIELNLRAKRSGEYSKPKTGFEG